MADQGGIHTEHEDHPWTRRIPDHPQRTESSLFKQSRALMLALVKQCQPWVFGDGPWQDHHGGSCWVKGKKGPRMYLLSRGMEWSAQWCAAPDRTDTIRQEAEELVGAFPGTLEMYESLGFPADLARQILSEPITDAEGISRWCDSPFNASQPLPALAHVAVFPKGASYHHYPRPVVDIAYFKRDDFDLWVTDEKNRPHAVAPVAPRGSGDGRVEVLYSHPSSPLHRQHQAAHADGKRLILPPGHELARKAFARQR